MSFVKGLINISLLLLVLLPACTGNVCSIQAQVFRNIENEGFHRKLHSYVKLPYSHSWGKCLVAFKEFFPSGLYANPDELADLRRLGETYACPEGEVNIEASEFESSPGDVYVYEVLNQTDTLLSTYLTLPFHIRYHYPTKVGGYSNITLPSPWLLLRCSGKLGCRKKQIRAPCSPCDKNSCQWLNVSYSANADSFTLRVPVGNLNHATFVIVITMMVTGGGCLYVITSIQRCNHEAAHSHNKKKKHRS